MKIVRAIILVLLTAASPLVFADEIVVIVNKDSNISELSIKQAERIFLGRKRGMAVFDLPRISPLNKIFYQQISGRTYNQVRALWAKLVFSGRAQLPRQLLNSKEVKRAVAADKNAIGYIDASIVDDSVKVVLRLQ